jgi:segregation and condensation protein A
MAEDYRVNLEVFEGPLDLLLFLVRRHDVEIDEVPIVEIVDQYLNYLDFMRDLKIDMAGDFLVMAATLIEIKAAKLLPKDEEEEEEDGDEGKPDPEEELRRLLKEYEKFKDAAEQLADRDMLSQDVFARKFISADIKETELPQRKVQVSIDLLIEAVHDIMGRAPKGSFRDVTIDRLSVAERLNELIEVLSVNTRVYFRELFEEDNVDKQKIIVTFLAILELIRLQVIRCYQAERFGAILIEKTISADELNSIDLGNEIDEYSQS